METNRIAFTIHLMFGFLGVENLKMMKSNFFGISAFNAPLSASSMLVFEGLGLITTVVEDLPQFVFKLQLIVLLVKQRGGAFTLFALIFTFSTILYSFSYKFSAAILYAVGIKQQEKSTYNTEQLICEEDGGENGMNELASTSQTMMRMREEIDQMKLEIQQKASQQEVSKLDQDLQHNKEEVQAMNLFDENLIRDIVYSYQRVIADLLNE